MTSLRRHPLERAAALLRRAWLRQRAVTAGCPCPSTRALGYFVPGYLP